MPKQSITEILSESCIGCKHQHVSMSVYRCYRYDRVCGEFICYVSMYSIYPKPLYEKCYEEDK